MVACIGDAFLPLGFLFTEQLQFHPLGKVFSDLGKSLIAGGHLKRVAQDQAVSPVNVVPIELNRLVVLLLWISK